MTDTLIIPNVQRCAIYTRKSSENGLEQEFNSLHAQRESAFAYIQSQRHEGWVLIDDHYDDGGYSGGNMSRPGLQRLLKDIEANKIDTVVVYKIDRLTRSLADFSRLVELFEQHQVTFVAVTQQFNTTTSMGRLTLNILLSFAQFERELTSERVRDKFAIARKKGKWMGGVPPLGYYVDNRKLLIDESEAALVKLLFTTLIETKSVLATCQHINEQGYVTRKTVTVNGRIWGGKPFTPSYVYKIIRNRIYLGEVHHKGTWYAGEHTAILDETVWQTVQQLKIRTHNEKYKHERGKKPCNQTAPLKGLLYDEDGFALTPSHTRKKGRLYRYYVSSQALKFGYDNSPLPNIPAEPLEKIVIELLRELLMAPDMLVKITQASEGKLTEQQVTHNMQQLDKIWQTMHPDERRQLLQLLIDRITLTKEKIEVTLQVDSVLLHHQNHQHTQRFNSGGTFINNKALEAPETPTPETR